MFTPIHRISIEKQQLIEATHRIGLDTDQSSLLSFSTLHRDQWHISWGDTSRTHPLAVSPLDLDFFIDNNNDAALHGTFMFDLGLDSVSFDFTSDDHSSCAASIDDPPDPSLDDYHHRSSRNLDRDRDSERRNNDQERNCI